jgi:hypothetical protein
MSMADNRRNRPDYSDDALAPKSQGTSPQGTPQGDPLAELARLIGQNDPFADVSRPSARKPLDVQADDRPAPEWLSRPAPEHDHDQDLGEYDHPAPRADTAPRAASAPTRYRDEYRADLASFRPSSDAAPHASDSHAEGAHRHGDQDYADEYPAEESQHDAHAQDREAHPQDHDDRPDRGDDRYRVALPPQGDYDGDGYYAEDGHLPPQGEETYAPSRRRGGLVTVAAIIGLAVVGTAGAFGYRSFTNGSAATANPPVIKADTSPAKIVPPTATASADGQNKPIQDRIGAPGAERVVPREEQPVSLPVTRGLQAPPQAAFNTASQPPLVTAPPQANPTPLNEPKRVRTMTIRPEANADPAQPTGATQPIGAARAPAAKSGPLTIAPQSETRTQAEPRTKVAARTPPAQAAGGAYVVQVSAQRTEEEAQSSYRALQQKYPAVLGSREANIRRVDLRDKGGIFYRAQVGSFATSEQASTFCETLRNAGGQCIVAKN